MIRNDEMYRLLFYCFLNRSEDLQKDLQAFDFFAKESRLSNTNLQTRELHDFLNIIGTSLTTNRVCDTSADFVLRLIITALHDYCCESFSKEAKKDESYKERFRNAFANLEKDFNVAYFYIVSLANCKNANISSDLIDKCKIDYDQMVLSGLCDTQFYLDIWQRIENTAVETSCLSNMDEVLLMGEQIYFLRRSFALIHNRSHMPIGSVGNDGEEGLIATFFRFAFLITMRNDVDTNLLRISKIYCRNLPESVALVRLKNIFSAATAILTWSELTDSVSGRVGEGAVRIALAVTQIGLPDINAPSYFYQLDLLQRVHFRVGFVDDDSELHDACLPAGPIDFRLQVQPDFGNYLGESVKPDTSKPTRTMEIIYGLCDISVFKLSQNVYFEAFGASGHVFLCGLLDSFDLESIDNQKLTKSAAHFYKKLGPLANLATFSIDWTQFYATTTDALLSRFKPKQIAELRKAIDKTLLELQNARVEIHQVKDKELEQRKELVTVSRAEEIKNIRLAGLINQDNDIFASDNFLQNSSNTLPSENNNQLQELTIATNTDTKEMCLDTTETLPVNSALAKPAVVACNEEQQVMPVEQQQVIPVEQQQVVPVEQQQVMPVEQQQLVPLEQQQLVPVEQQQVVLVEQQQQVPITSSESVSIDEKAEPLTSSNLLQSIKKQNFGPKKKKFAAKRNTVKKTAISEDKNADDSSDCIVDLDKDEQAVDLKEDDQGLKQDKKEDAEYFVSFIWSNDATNKKPNARLVAKSFYYWPLMKDIMFSYGEKNDVSKAQVKEYYDTPGWNVLYPFVNAEQIQYFAPKNPTEFIMNLWNIEHKDWPANTHVLPSFREFESRRKQFFNFWVKKIWLFTDQETCLVHINADVEPENDEVQRLILGCGFLIFKTALLRENLGAKFKLLQKSTAKKYPWSNAEEAMEFLQPTKKSYKKIIHAKDYLFDRNDGIFMTKMTVAQAVEIFGFKDDSIDLPETQSGTRMNHAKSQTDADYEKKRKNFKNNNDNDDDNDKDNDGDQDDHIAKKSRQIELGIVAASATGQKHKICGVSTFVRMVQRTSESSRKKTETYWLLRENDFVKLVIKDASMLNLKTLTLPDGLAKLSLDEFPLMKLN